MARYKTLEEIILSMLNFGSLAQPDASLAPGSVARDLTIDMPAVEIARVYDELRVAAGFQDIISSSGAELDRKARNYGKSRLSGRPAFGTAVLTANVLDSNISIPINTIFTARNGQSFKTTTETVVDASKPNLYRSVAVRLQADLQSAGIFDQFAVEVSVSAVAPGSSGNISKFQLTRSNIAGLPSITNTSVFSGGTGVETDSAFRSRILAVFQGAAMGTDSAYLAAVLADTRVSNAHLIGPGNPLMVRDGTIVSVDEEGIRRVLSSGSGGKVDIEVQGEDIRQNIESYIYLDHSGRLDASDISNRYVLGQREADASLDFPQKRRNAALTGLYPLQPVKQIISLSGSLSGPNFQQAYVDEFGIKRGNFELVKDTGAYSGSTFGFDSVRFISNEISLSEEQISKPLTGSSDPLDFSEVNRISAASQLVALSREVVAVDSSNRQFVTLRHTPFSSVDRITNTTTGERYRIVSQNPDGITGEPNLTGRVQISGATLPRANDVVEANYGWTVQFDSFIDFDNLEDSSRIRTATDSIDWGFSSRIEAEETETLHSIGDGYHILTSFPILRVVNVLTYTEESVVRANSSLVLADNITSILSVLDSSGRECYSTTAADGSVSGSTIRLPSDSLLPNGATATVRYNVTDIFSPTGTDQGSFSGNKITLSDVIAPTTPVLVDYISSYLEVIPASPLLSLPAVGSENEWVVGGSFVGEQPTTFEWTAGTRGRAYKIAPSYLRFVLSNIPSSGRLLINGTVWKKIESTYTYTGGTFDVSQLIEAKLGALPASVSLAHVAKLRRVTLSNGQISAELSALDLLNYELLDSTWSRTAIENSTLSATQFSLASTTANADAAPAIGDTISITFYVVYPGSERIAVAASGEAFSSSMFAHIDEVRVDAGFRNISAVISGTISVFAFGQPQTNTQYSVSYDYVAPKQGERLTLTYDYNGLLTDLISVVEPVRPIGADVLIKEKEKVTLWIDLDIVALSTFKGNTETLKSQVEQNVIAFVNSSPSSVDIDASDIVKSVYNVNGVDRVSVTRFNTSDSVGVKQTIPSDESKYFVAGSVAVSLVSK
jgi:uncharacterized phage protein gp47/JayE